MTRTPYRRTAPATLLAVVLSGLAALEAAPLVAHDFRGGDIELLHPTVPPTPPGARSAAGYLAIVNTGTEDERLLGGDAAFADNVELHRTTVEDDVARMRRLDDGLAIPAGETVSLEPGGTHLMFTGVAEPLGDGERRPVTLRFERAGEVEVDFAIERPEPGGTAREAVDHGTMDHGAMDHDGTVHEGKPNKATSGGATGRDGTDHGETSDMQ